MFGRSKLIKFLKIVFIVFFVVFGTTNEYSYGQKVNKKDESGKKQGKFFGSLPNSIKISETIVRLPIWIGMTETLQNQIIGRVNNFKA